VDETVENQGTSGAALWVSHLILWD